MNVCNGRGDCVTDDVTGAATCMCSDGYAGATCDATICSDDVTCLNGGRCVEEGCSCVYPYSGNTCEEADACSYVDCDFGRCESDGEGEIF